MSIENAIEVEHVSKSFRLPHERNTSIKSAVINFYKKKRSFEKQDALQEITFNIEEGEFFGIVGRNGSGKSTLLKLLAGIYIPSSGSMQVNGKLIPFIELGVGFNPELTGRENVYLNGALLGFNRKEMNDMYEDIVEFAELKRFMDQKLKNYSSGMQVRLAFSIAIRAKGDILLLDEVLAVGDAAFQQKCYKYFEELKVQHRTVVFVSHDMAAITRFCTKAVYIKDGKLIKEGSPTDIADLYVEENIESGQKTTKKEEAKQLTAFKISVSAIKQTDDKVYLKFNYQPKDRTEMYLGISIIQNGISVSELTTPMDKPLVGEGDIEYVLDTTVFNAGVYLVDAALFRRKNRELLGAVYNKKARFTIKGHDITRGSAIKLADTWKYND